MKTHLLAISGVLACLGLAAPASAQDLGNWPAKPLTMVVPSSPGGVSDIVGRLVADGLSQRIGRPVVVRNIPGAGSAAGNAAVSTSPPDGYTLIVNPPAPITIVPLLRPDLNYKASDLQPVSQVFTNAHLLVVNPKKISARTLPDLIELLKKNPNKYSYATSGIGSTYHLGTELFMHATGTKMTHVPFRSSGEGTTAVLGGHVDLEIMSPAQIMPMLRDKRLYPIAVMTAKRDPEMPDIPSVKEFYPDYIGYASWSGIFTRAGTPKPIVDKLSSEIVAFLKTPEAIKKLRDAGVQPASSTADEFAAVLAQEMKMWADLVKASNIKLQ